MNIQSLITSIIKQQDLSEKETSFILSEIMAERVSDVTISSLLTALSMKGETIEEIVGFIRKLREHMISIPAVNAIDVCGTGGDGKHTFNISTAVSLVVAGAGVPVVKHGNRAASSLCGSADVLEKLGVHIMLSPEQAVFVFNKTGIVFLFAPLFHPSLRKVSLVRKELGIRTVFNYLGPFCNPAHVANQVIGVPTISIAEKLIQVGEKLHYEQLLILTSESGMDEASVSEKTYMYELKNNEISRSILDPKDYGFHYGTEDITGGDASENAEIITTILDGKKDVKRDIVVFNSALALYVSGKVNSIQEGIALANQSIDTGCAKKVLEILKKETQQYA